MIKTVNTRVHKDFKDVVREMAKKTELSEVTVTKKIAKFVKINYKKRKEKNPFSLFD